MKAVSIVPEVVDGNGVIYRAMVDGIQSTGSSAGEALDRLAARLDPSESGTLFVVQSFAPDAYFTSDQRRRLDELMGRWRLARNGGAPLPQSEQAELESLTKAEIEAALHRTRELHRKLAS